jgi:hypothetical protein
MIGQSIGLYDVGTNASLTVEHWVDLGRGEDDEPIGLAYTTASHGHLVQVRSGCLRCTYDVSSSMLDEDADRVGRWLSMDGVAAVRLIREHAKH